MLNNGAWSTIALVCAQDTKYSAYMAELLRYCGFFFDQFEEDSIQEACQTATILILSGHMELYGPDQEAIRSFVTGGGALISVGGTSGLDELLGVQTVRAESGEGYLAPSAEHEALDGDPFPIHHFGGHAAHVTTATMLASQLDPHHRPTDLAGLTLTEADGGPAFFLSPNLGIAALRMRQGRYVDMDGVPAPDGSANLQDGYLRSEDGSVLDWHLDRSGESGEDPPGFLHPQLDRLWGILLRSILFAAETQGRALPLLWFHPRNATGAGVVSFNTDGRDPQNAVSILHQANLVGLRGTWCVRQPGYHSDLYRVLRNRSNEVGAAFDPGDEMWGKELVKMQTTQMIRVSGAKHMSSIRPAEGRWQGRNGLYEWCVDLNLTVEMGRGPHQAGNTGFLFGTCHPFRPIRSDGGTYGLTSLPFHSYNPGIQCSSARCLSLIDRVAFYHGIVHFSIDTDRFEEKAVSEAFRNIVVHGRSNGMEWLTAEEVGAFQRARRLVRGSLSQVAEGLSLVLTGDLDLLEASVLVLGRPVVGARANSRVVKPQVVRRFGRLFSALTVDLQAKRPVELVLERRQSERAA